MAPTDKLPKGYDVLRGMVLIRKTNMHAILKSLIEEHEGKVPDLHNYLDDHNYSIKRSSVYRYFSSNQNSKRTPDENFLRIFGKYIGLSDEEIEALVDLNNYYLDNRPRTN
ncbi:MAG: hypothetical protein ACLFTK_15570 [Anaerolineales bacterium]